MTITSVRSFVLSYDLEDELGYSQQYYTKRTAHLVRIETREGLVGWGECFGPGHVAVANRAIVEEVIAPMIVGENPLDRERLWHKVYNLLRDHGQKGMPIQALSGIDIALWDVFGKLTDQPIYNLLGGRCRERLQVYGYGMMLRRDHDGLAERFADEARAIEAAGFRAIKMKVGLGAKADIALVRAVREAVGPNTQVMVDANHAYTTSDAFYVGRALDDMDIYWFEEPVAPEDLEGYAELRHRLSTNISGGEAEFTRWGWRPLLERRCLDIAQPEVCGLGGISEYQKVLALAHAHFTPVNNHVWGSAIAIAANMHLLAAMPPLPGGLHPWEPMLEFDTTPNLFRDALLRSPFNIQDQIAASDGTIDLPDGPGLGIEPDAAFLERYAVSPR